MADPSAAASPADEAPDPGSPEATNGAPQGAKEQEDIRGEAAVPTSQPVREELVQNAVTFLGHPKVVASSDVQRRSFLENKGLTVDEIEEAFRRLLSPPSNSTNSNMCESQGSPDPETVTPVVPQHPKSYMEVMEMIQRGERPDDIQDINDEPPNPDQPISKPRMAPKPKPWEKQGAPIRHLPPPAVRPLLRQQPARRRRPPGGPLLAPSAASAMASPALISDTDQWKALQAHVGAIHKTHLRDLMADADRCKAMTAEFEGVFLDYARQQATTETVDKLFKLAEAAKLKEKIDKMFKGEKINSTENRSVLHVALRAPRDAVINSDGLNVVPEVWAVKDKIKQFSETFRSGSWVGATGKPLTNVVSVGIGGSFLGPLFVHTALQTDPEAAECAKGRQLRFLANVDPVDVARSIKDLDPATTLVVVVSKTFTTAETMLNARTIKEWIVSSLGPDAVSKHMIAVSTNLKLVKEFGIDPNNAFAFWDWVGGRYSVCSAVGVLPLSLQYGFPIVQKFLEGASSIDNHFHTSSFEKNIPVLLGLLSVWNVSFLGYPARAILPYSQALEKLAPHIQQLSMESNGKGVSIDGVRLPYEAGEIDFGEPGTNGQHSFYQLIHQGRVIPCDFIGVIKSQQPVYLKGETVSNHDELMSNFFAQPDALAYGKTPEQLHSEKVPENLIPHKTFQGNRPSLSFLLSSLSAYEIGQLLSIYEHRIAVQGFIWGINSFDQWGVELGKSLASTVRKQLHASRMEGKPVEGFNPSSASLLTRFLAVKPSTPYDTTVLPKV